jgi:hypothetical protein
MGFHAEVPLVAFLGLVHLWIPLFRAILCRTGRCNNGRVDDGVTADGHTLRG